MKNIYELIPKEEAAIKECPHCGGVAKYEEVSSKYWCKEGCPWGIN